MMGVTGDAVRLALMLGAAAALAGCATDADRVPSSQRLWTAQGDPVSCITIRNIRSTNVVDDRTINFVVGSNRMFRNELPVACPGLGFSRAFKHNSRTSQLCSVDTITVIQPGRSAGAQCGLGRFQPMVPVDTLPAK
jgi:hypothetical protein